MGSSYFLFHFDINPDSCECLKSAYSKNVSEDLSIYGEHVPTYMLHETIQCYQNMQVTSTETLCRDMRGSTMRKDTALTKYIHNLQSN